LIQGKGHNQNTQPMRILRAELSPREHIKLCFLAIALVFGMSNLNAQSVVGVANEATCPYYAKVQYAPGCNIFGSPNGWTAEYVVGPANTVNIPVPAGAVCVKLELRRSPGLINPVKWSCGTGNGTWLVTQANGSCLGGSPALHFQKHPTAFSFRIYP
jgi:hypothetical protein